MTERRLNEEDLDFHAEDHPDTEGELTSPDLGQDLEGVKDIEGETL